MANLQNLSRRIELTKQKKSAPKKKPRAKKTPTVDRSVEKAIKESTVQISGALTLGLKSIGSKLDKLIKRPEAPQISPEMMEKAVAKGVEKIKMPELEVPERQPVSYRATIERRGKQMTGAIIEPIQRK